MKHLATFFSILLGFQVVGQEIESEVGKLTTYIRRLTTFPVTSRKRKYTCILTTQVIIKEIISGSNVMSSRPDKIN